MTKVWLALIITLGLSGCGLHPQLADPSSANDAIFRPPTQQPTLTPTLAAPAAVTSPRSTPLIACKDNLTFVNDQTIPDGTQVSPNSTLDKRWEVENSGTCNWDELYHIRLIGGPELGAAPVQSLFPARSGTRVIIRILMTAPAEPGSYHSAWQAYNPADEPFGDPFFIDIVVK
jgi:hypothetical protein